MEANREVKSAGLNNRDWHDTFKILDKVNEGQALVMIRKLLKKLQGTSDQIVHDVLVENCWKLKAITDDENGKSVSIYQKEDMEITWTEPKEDQDEKLVCSKCGTPINPDDYITADEPREYWGSTVYERVATGYKCPKCGHKENF